MLTLFAHPKPFKGHFSVIQRNAISQWARLRPRPEIILFGNEEGTAEIAQEFGLRHIPEVERNEYGTPLLSDLFGKAQALASTDTLCYVNADIMLLGDFMGAVQRVASWRERFLMVGRRTDVELDEPAIYKSPEQEVRLQALVKQQNRPTVPYAIDYFVFPKKRLISSFPPFAIGRPGWDNWFLWKARELNAALVDASDVIFAVHQDHDFSHHPQGWQGVRDGEEAKWNRTLAENHCYTIEDATHKLTSKRISYNCWHLLAPTKRALDPWWKARWKALGSITAPVRLPLGLRQETIARVLGKLRVSSARNSPVAKSRN